VSARKAPFVLMAVLSMVAVFAAPVSADPAKPPKAVTAWLNSNAIALASVDAGTGFADLDALGPSIGDARLVGIGEATHGSSEFFRFKHRLFEFLVERLGFRTFVMEAGYAEGLVIDQYLQTGIGTAADAARATRFWTWSTPEVAAMLQWMRDYNADPAHSSKIHFYGDDMQFPGSSASYAVEYLEEVDAAAVTGALAAVARFTDDNFPFGYAQLPQAQRDADEAALVALLASFDAHEAQYVAASSQRAFDLARQAVVVTIQGKHYWESSFPDDLLLRDDAMATNTLWAMNEAGGRAMLWAHDFHVFGAPQEGWYNTQGTHLRAALGNDYVAIGQEFDRGSFTALKESAAKGVGYPITGLVQFTVGSSAEGSLNDALASARPSRYIVDIRQAMGDPMVGGWWSAPHGERSIGAVYLHPADPYFYEPQIAPAGYDMLVEMDTVTAAAQLPWP